MGRSGTAVTKLNIILMAVLALCALGLVTSQDRARNVFVELERAHTQTRQLEIQTNRLELDQYKLSKTALVDGKARRELAMQPAKADRTLHVNLAGDTPHQAMKAQESKANR